MHESGAACDPSRVLSIVIPVRDEADNVAPLARDQAAGTRPSLKTLVLLGLVGGVPTIAGAWLGGFAYSPIWSVIFLALGVGAIAQVTAQILSQVAGERPTLRYLGSGPVIAGLAAGFALMYVTGTLLG